MAIYDVTAPSSVVAATKAKALVAAHQGTTVQRRVIPPPPSAPSFLKDLVPLYGDDCSAPDPLAAGRWALAPMQRKDGRQESSTKLSDLAPGRYTHHLTGGPSGGPFYEFHAPQGDNIWTPGSAGRAEFSYPRGGDQGATPDHRSPDPGDAFFFFEGRSYVVMTSIRLPVGWNVDAPAWRGLMQFKQSEWEDQSGISPALALEERGGNYIITNLGGPIIWSTHAEAGTWLRFAIAVTYSGDPAKGKVKVYLDKDLDGNYEYASDEWTGRTLHERPEGGSYPSTIHEGLYEGVGGDSAHNGGTWIWGKKY